MYKKPSQTHKVCNSYFSHDHSNSNALFWPRVMFPQRNAKSSVLRHGPKM